MSISNSENLKSITSLEMVVDHMSLEWVTIHRNNLITDHPVVHQFHKDAMVVHRELIHLFFMVR